MSDSTLSQKLSGSLWSEKLPRLARLSQIVAEEFLGLVVSSSQKFQVVHTFSSNRGSTKVTYLSVIKGSSEWEALLDKTLIPEDLLARDPTTYILWSVILRLKTKDYKILFVSVLPNLGNSTLEDPPIKDWYIRYQHFSSISKGIF